MREAVTTALDALGLLAVAAGVALAVEPVIGGGALAAGGVIVLAGVRLADHLQRPRRPRDGGR